MKTVEMYYADCQEGTIRRVIVVGPYDKESHESWNDTSMHHESYWKRCYLLVDAATKTSIGTMWESADNWLPVYSSFEDARSRLLKNIESARSRLEFVIQEKITVAKNDQKQKLRTLAEREAQIRKLRDPDSGTEVASGENEKGANA